MWFDFYVILELRGVTHSAQATEVIFLRTTKKFDTACPLRRNTHELTKTYLLELWTYWSQTKYTVCSKSRATLETACPTCSWKPGSSHGHTSIKLKQEVSASFNLPAPFLIWPKTEVNKGGAYFPPGSEISKLKRSFLIILFIKPTKFAEFLILPTSTSI